jgi:hypothetical protein
MTSQEIKNLTADLDTDPTPHWYIEVEKQQWKPFEDGDSEVLENLFWSFDVEKREAVVNVKTKTFDFNKMLEVGKPTKKILRATWFWQTDENNWSPYDQESAQILEKSFKSGKFFSEIVVLSKKPMREVRLHVDGSFKQYRRGKKAKPDGRPVQRGYKGKTCKLYPDYEFAPTSSQIFGIPLELAMKHPLSEKYPVPHIIVVCTDYIRKEGPTTENLFIEKALPSQVQELKEYFNSGYIPDLSGRDPNAVATVLKQYFDSLPDPLCTNFLSESWQNLYIHKNSPDLIVNIKQILEKLPPLNLSAFQILLSLFHYITKVTEITALTISEKWAYTLYRADLFTVDPIKEVLRTMIISCDELFSEQQNQPDIPIEPEPQLPQQDFQQHKNSPHQEYLHNEQPQESHQQPYQQPHQQPQEPHQQLHQQPYQQPHQQPQEPHQQPQQNIPLPQYLIPQSQQNNPFITDNHPNSPPESPYPQSLFPTDNPYTDTDDNPIILQTWNG